MMKTPNVSHVYTFFLLLVYVAFLNDWFVFLSLRSSVGSNQIRLYFLSDFHIPPNRTNIPVRTPTGHLLIEPKYIYKKKTLHPIRIANWSRTLVLTFQNRGKYCVRKFIMFYVVYILELKHCTLKLTHTHRTHILVRTVVYVCMCLCMYVRIGLGKTTNETIELTRCVCSQCVFDSLVQNFFQNIITPGICNSI